MSTSDQYQDNANTATRALNAYHSRAAGRALATNHSRAVGWALNAYNSRAMVATGRV